MDLQLYNTILYTSTLDWLSFRMSSIKYKFVGSDRSSLFTLPCHTIRMHLVLTHSALWCIITTLTLDHYNQNNPATIMWFSTLTGFTRYTRFAIFTVFTIFTSSTRSTGFAIFRGFRIFTRDSIFSRFDQFSQVSLASEGSLLSHIAPVYRRPCYILNWADNFFPSIGQISSFYNYTQVSTFTFIWLSPLIYHSLKI